VLEFERDKGLGTAYERVAMIRFLEGLQRRYAFERVLEGPTDEISGIRGLNSIPLAQSGASVEVVLPDAEETGLAERIWASLGLADSVSFRTSVARRLDVEPRSFDLVWNFNSIPRGAEPDRLVGEMCEASGRYVMIFTMNPWNYGVPVHRLHHRATGEPWAHGDPELMQTKRIVSMLSRHGFDVVDRFLLDVPWWPDIDSPIEQVARDLIPFVKGGAKATSKRLEQFTFGEANLPYFEPESLAALENEIGRHGFIERAKGLPLRILFAHHRGILAERTATGAETA